MCGGFLGSLLSAGPLGMLGIIKSPAEKSAKRQAASAAASLQAQEDERKRLAELKKSQRKATETVLTTGQGLAGPEGVTLG
jgi:hypothetical protein